MKAFSVKISDIDISQLPSSDQSKTGSDLEEAICSYFRKEYSNEDVVVYVKNGAVVVEPPPSIDAAVDCFNNGDRERGLEICDLILSVDPEDVMALMNSGMALSDKGDYENALFRLKKAFSIHETGNIATGIGVAYSRRGDVDDAIEWFEIALKLDKKNIFAFRNLCATLMKKGDYAQVIYHMKPYVKENPLDQNSLYIYGMALFESGNTSEADEYLKAAIDIAPYNEIAGMCKSVRSKIASSGFKKIKNQVNLRMDAVMYLVDAMKEYSNRNQQEQMILFQEVCMVGMKGLDTNSPDQKYKLKSLPGKPMSGLNMVCVMYEGARRFAPEADMGFDLTEEYEEAKKLFGEQG